MRILLALTSLSGNTRDVARQVHARCEEAGHVLDWIETDVQSLADAPLPASDYGLFLLGSWTQNAGRTPSEMKRFIADLVEAIGKPTRVAVFGTGETQWGEEYFCGAVHRIAAFFASPFPRLLIEQMPHGERDAAAIDGWISQVLATCPDNDDTHEHADHYRHVA
jgi:predicted ribonucleotide reductase-associated flavodoxin